MELLQARVLTDNWFNWLYTTLNYTVPRHQLWYVD